MNCAAKDYIESWFFDKFCKAEGCKSQSEFIDRTWNMFTGNEDSDIVACYNDVLKEDTNATYIEVKNLLSDYANEVIYSFYEDDMLPEKYVNAYIA